MTDPILIDDIPDFYEHERLAAARVTTEMNQKYFFSGREYSEDAVAREMEGRFADEANMDVSITFEWDTTDIPGDMRVWRKPNIVINGRVAKLKEFDHDLQKHEVRDGVFDGVKGVIDPNTGQFRDEPKRKTIT